MSDLNVLIFHVLSLCFFCVAAQGSKYTGPLTGELEVTTSPKTHTSSTSMYKKSKLVCMEAKKRNYKKCNLSNFSQGIHS